MEEDNYIEKEYIKWSNIFVAILAYPILVLGWITVIIVGIIGELIKITRMLIMAVIPILNATIATEENTFGKSVYEIYKTFDFTPFRFKYTKRLEDIGK